MWSGGANSPAERTPTTTNNGGRQAFIGKMPPPPVEVSENYHVSGAVRPVHVGHRALPYLTESFAYISVRAHLYDIAKRNNADKSFVLIENGQASHPRYRSFRQALKALTSTSAYWTPRPATGPLADPPTVPEAEL